jgi:glycosyltransferase involved in cell wall biosynthesis
MKVLHVIGIYPIPPLGGMETVVVNLAKETSQLGTEVRVMAPAPKNLYTDYQGCTYYGLRSGFITLWIQFPTIESIGMMRKQVKWADIVHIHNPTELFNIVAFGLAVAAHKKIVLSVLSPGELHGHPKAAIRFGGRFLDRFQVWQMRHVAFVHVKNSNDMQFATAHHANCELIPDGLPAALFESPVRGAEFKKARGLEGNHPILLYVGRVNRLKGPDHLVRAIPSLIARFPRVTAVIAGPDVDKMVPELIALSRTLHVEDNVRVVGVLDDAEKIAALDAADVVVIPSLADFVEGFSIVASEAWARHKPVVGYPVGALRVRIHDGKDGYLAKDVDPASLAEAISSALALGAVKSPPGDVVGWRSVSMRFDEKYSSILGNSNHSHSSPGQPTVPVKDKTGS